MGMKLVSAEEMIAIAKDTHQTYDVEIHNPNDTNEMFSTDDDEERQEGTWVRAWVWVPGYVVKPDG